jgi:putative transposase
MNLSNAEKIMLIEKEHTQLSISDQCQYLSLPRASYYYRPCGENELNIELMHRLDELYTTYPFFGYRKMTNWLKNKEGYTVNYKRIARLMEVMGLTAIYPKKHLSEPHPGHIIYPYLLRNVAIGHPYQVWSADITYIRLVGGFVYLVAVIDWFSRYILAWELSNSLDTYFCLKALKKALEQGNPFIFNTDQGCQFTSLDFTRELLNHQIRISMDGKGRALDNIFVERLWRSVKYENVYIKGYATISEAYQGLSDYFDFYNNDRPHQSLDYRTPAQVHFETPSIQQAL